MGFARRDNARAIGALVNAGFRPKEFLNWTDTEMALAAATVLQLEAWRLETVAKIWGGK